MLNIFSARAGFSMIDEHRHGRMIEDAGGEPE